MVRWWALSVGFGPVTVSASSNSYIKRRPLELEQGTRSSAFSRRSREDRAGREFERASIVVTCLGPKRTCVGDHRRVVRAGAKMRDDELDPAGSAEVLSTGPKAAVGRNSSGESDRAQAFL